ncbi:N-6 DNA methylase [Rothia terrae]|uniref:HsdM family class I SAM-dependent methyltransferase n=1 Tax=Rothia terrae TaxID=396015 RepID=UPI0014473FE9|nr:N-6 DNA methylase [Rothia terrae]
MWSISDSIHRKKFGQFFTPNVIAEFMKGWVLEDKPSNILDPALGPGILLENIKEVNKIGYEIDSSIYEHFQIPDDVDIYFKDFLISDWDKKYDAIICNPPYNRFQNIEDRTKIKSLIEEKLNCKISGFSNQSLLFLWKCIYQLEEMGRLSIILPSDFLGLRSGIEIKKYLTENNLIHSLILLDSTKALPFENVLTTACILNIQKKHNKQLLYAKNISLNDLRNDIFDRCEKIKFSEVNPMEDWNKSIKYDFFADANYVELKEIAKCSRGIATGDNSFFIFDKAQMEKSKIPVENFDLVIARSADITGSILDNKLKNKMVENGKIKYLFNPIILDQYTQEYIDYGELSGVNKKYLCSKRNKWWKPEDKSPSIIWITPQYRVAPKIIFNNVHLKNLTCFHSIYIKGDKNLSHALFKYLSSEKGLSEIIKVSKQMANGLYKLQPGDVNRILLPIELFKNL